MTGEIVFQSMIRDVAKARGWRVFRTPSSRYGAHGGGTSNGYPDLTLVRRGQMLILEIKADKGVISEAQQAWLEDLGDVAALSPNIIARVVRPRDYDEIVRLLA